MSAVTNPYDAHYDEAVRDVQDAIDALLLRGGTFEYDEVLDSLMCGQHSMLVAAQLFAAEQTGLIVREGFRPPACKHERPTPLYRGVA